MPAAKTRSFKKNAQHPFKKAEPKPTRARLVSLLDPLGRKRYGEVERFLATVTGASSGLHYYNNDWGWAVRYMLGSKESLCILHLLPEIFEATLSLDERLDIRNNGASLSPEVRRRIGRTRPIKGTRWFRMPLKNDADYGSFQTLIHLKSGFLRDREVQRSRSAKAKPTKKGKAKSEPKKRGRERKAARVKPKPKRKRKTVKKR